MPESDDTVEQSPDETIGQFLDEVRPSIEAALDQILPSANQVPENLHRAMRYSIFAGGKRLRPAFCLAGYRAFHSHWQRALPVAASVELIHTYSLIHDDLPAMDDDDFRRGRPSCHREFGEATAILAGDGLLTLAFDTVARVPGFSADRLLEVSRMLGDAAGSVRGMIAGQVLDLEAEDSLPDTGRLEAIHRAKTGALIEASIAIGAYLAGAGDDVMSTVSRFGRSVGLAFQIVDDILDETSPITTLGKTPGKDRRQGKATYPGVHGIESSWEMVRQITADAREAAAELGTRGRLLTALADQLEARTT